MTTQEAAGEVAWAGGIDRISVGSVTHIVTANALGNRVRQLSGLSLPLGPDVITVGDAETFGTPWATTRDAIRGRDLMRKRGGMWN